MCGVKIGVKVAETGEKSARNTSARDRTPGRAPLKTSPSTGAGGPRGPRAAGGKTIMYCTTSKVFAKKGVQHGKRSL